MSKSSVDVYVMSLEVPSPQSMVLDEYALARLRVEAGDAAPVTVRVDKNRYADTGTIDPADLVTFLTTIASGSAYSHHPTLLVRGDTYEERVRLERALEQVAADCDVSSAFRFEEGAKHWGVSAVPELDLGTWGALLASALRRAEGQPQDSDWRGLAQALLGKIGSDL